MNFGQLHTINNGVPRFGEQPWYYRLLIKNEQGEFETLLLTEKELERVRKRVESNPEERITPTLADRVRSS